MKIAVVLSCFVAVALSVPVDQADYKKPEYKEIEEQAPVKELHEVKLEASKYEEPLDKSVYPYVVSRAFPYDYRGFPYLNNEFPNGYPTPRHPYYSPVLAPYPYHAVPAYQAPLAYRPSAHAGPAAHAPVAHAPAAHAPAAHAPVDHAPVAHAPALRAPQHPAPVKEVAKPEYDSMKYYGKFSKGCVGDGIYYNDLDSFVLCSNGNPYVQRCAPGTKNQGADHYTYGSNYSFKDLCGVNLVDTGYGPSNIAY